MQYMCVQVDNQVSDTLWSTLISLNSVLALLSQDCTTMTSQKIMLRSNCMTKPFSTFLSIACICSEQ